MIHLNMGEWKKGFGYEKGHERWMCVALNVHLL